MVKYVLNSVWSREEQGILWFSRVRCQTERRLQLKSDEA